MNLPPPENESANKNYFFLLGRWVNTEPAKLFAVFEDLGSFKTFDASFPSSFDDFSLRAIAFLLSLIRKKLLIRLILSGWFFMLRMSNKKSPLTVKQSG